MPQDIFTWLRCVFFRGCAQILASIPTLPEIDHARATAVMLALIGVALLSPLPEYLGRLFVTKQPATAPPFAIGRQGVDVRAQLWHLHHPSIGDLRLHELERQLRIKLLHAYTLLETATDAQLATDWAHETYDLIRRQLGPQEARRFWDGNPAPC